MSQTTRVPRRAESGISTLSRCRRPSASQLAPASKDPEDARKYCISARTVVGAAARCRSWHVILLGCMLFTTFVLLFQGHATTVPYLMARLKQHRRRRNTLPHSRPGPFLLGIVTDLDKRSARRLISSNVELAPTKAKDANRWVSIYKSGELKRSPNNNRFDIQWIDETTIIGSSAYRGRGMELSDLVWFNGKLLTPDDRTGILYELAFPGSRLSNNLLAGRRSFASGKPLARKVANLDFDMKDDDGVPFKAEWMAAKEGNLVIGGHGRERTKPDDGSAVVSLKPMWVSILNEKWELRIEDWTSKYNALRKAAGAPFPGYMLHEAVLWSTLRREWIFLPRRVSNTSYDAHDTQRRGARSLFIASDDFSEIRSEEVLGLPLADGYRGFSAAAFVPETQEQWVIALRTVEADVVGKQIHNKRTATYLSIFDLLNLTAKELVLPEKEISGMKFEGISFIG